MNLDDIKERLLSEFKQISERIQDSSAFNQAKDRYENLNPTQQKLAAVAGIALVTVAVLWVPFSGLTSSWDHTNEFTERRDLIRDLLKVSKEASEAPSLPVAPSESMIRQAVDREITSARILPEQNKGTSFSSSANVMIPSNHVETTVDISLAKLNLRQVLDMGYAFQNISPSLKMKDLNIIANASDSKYFDVVYRLVALKVPQIQMQPMIDDDADSNSGDKPGTNKKPKKKNRFEK